MNKKISNVTIFVAGAVVGGVASYFATKQLVDKTYREAADEEIAKAADIYNKSINTYKEEIRQLNEKISRQKVTINTLADQVRENKGDPSDILKDAEDDAEADRRPKRAIKGVKREDAEPKQTEQVHRRYTYYSSIYSGTSEEEPEEVEFDPAEEEDSIAENSPRQIPEEVFSTTLEYSKEDLYYYLYDGKMISEDGEWIDNFERLTGKIGTLNAGEEIYIRNDELAVDYHITFMAGFGEQAISHTDIWDED